MSISRDHDLQLWLNANVSTRDDNHKLNLIKLQWKLRNDEPDLVKAECDDSSSSPGSDMPDCLISPPLAERDARDDASLQN